MNAFDDLKVLDFSTMVAGPGVTRWLSRLGAEVIKVERMGTGDDTRLYSPQIHGMGLPALVMNDGKKSVTMNLGDPEAVELLKKMIADVDILVESYKPGTMKKFGLDYESVKDINPRLIYCSISAYGQTGPDSHKPGYDIIAQALSGMMDITGDPAGAPQKIGTFLGDHVGRLAACTAIGTALHYRARTGEGQFLDVSLLHSLANMNMWVEYASVAGINMTRTGNHNVSSFPYGLFEGKDGQYAVVCAPSDKMWGNLCELMGKPELADDPESNCVMARIKNQGKLIPVVEEWLHTFDDMQDAIDLMDAKGIPTCKVRSTAELIKDEQFLQHEGLLEAYPSPSMVEAGAEGTFKVNGSPVLMSKTPETIQGPTPDLGQHNYEVLGRYGLTHEQIDALQEKWAQA